MIGPLSDVQVAYLLLFGATLFLVEGIYHLIRDTWGPVAGTNRRLRLIASGRDRDTVLNSLRRNGMDPVSAAIARAAPWAERLIREAGLVIPLRRLAMIAATISIALGTILTQTTGLPARLVVVAAVAVGAGLPLGALLIRRHIRVKEFGIQFPEALDMLVRSLRAGHPINSAVGMVAREMADPAGSEFGIVVDEMTYGFDLNTALQNLAARVPHPDLPFFVVAVQIQHQTGGNLSEILSNLARVIRERLTMKLKVRVITAQGRSSAFIIALMPLASAAAINLINGDYFGEVMHDPLFRNGMLLAAGMWAAGLVIIQKLVHFRI